MGVSALPDICEGLIGAGMEKDMPAAILQKGTTAGQKRIVATVSTLEEEVKRQGIETPAIIVWVRCVHWQRSLAGMKNFRFQDGKSLSQDRKSLFPEPRTSFVKKARRFWNFRRSVLFPWKTRTVSIKHWITWRNISGLYLPATGVRVFFEELDPSWKRYPCHGKCPFGRDRGRNKKGLKERGLLADFVPSVYDGDTLGKELSELLSGGEKILIPRQKREMKNSLHFLHRQVL